MKKTEEEKNLLKRLADGEFDGQVGDDLRTSGGSTVWTIIKDGQPTRYKQGPSTRSFNGEENERYPGVKHIQEIWETEDEKLQFFKKFGWLTHDQEAEEYSAKFKPKKK